MFRGINLDVDKINQQNTLRFAQNSLLTKAGFYANEESNTYTDNINTDSEELIHILGDVYIGNGDSVIFCKKSTTSTIGIVDSLGIYNECIDFPELNFNKDYKIDATYRLRRGCKRTIYFTDFLNEPKVINLDNLESLKVNGVYDIDKFKLFKSYNRVPEISKITTQQSGGLLLPGSYNFSIQYLDEDLNPTEWITTTECINIYNDNTNSKSFSNVRGSTNFKTAYTNFSNTSKSITLNFTYFDESYPFYRIAIIESNNGSGTVNNVFFSEQIPIGITEYTYTGRNYSTKGTELEIRMFNEKIEAAKSISQLENRLILSGLKSKQFNWCKLQKFASKISSQLVLEEITLNNIDSVNNPKRGEINFEKTGYMPGEIYSFGIVYVLKDGTKSPVYHIPGKASSYISQMSSNNKLENTYYTDNESCDDYWGKDVVNTTLLNKQVRHHRFPLRSEINLPLYEKVEVSSSITTSTLVLNITANYTLLPNISEITYKVYYKINGSDNIYTGTLEIQGYVSNEDNIVINNFIVAQTQGVITFTKIEQLDTQGNIITNTNINYTHNINTINTVSNNSVYKSKIFGIKFSNIVLPTIDNEEIIGYYIVRNEREEFNKTIVDNGLMLPLIEEKRPGVNKYIAHGQLMPLNSDVSKTVFSFISPEHKFFDKENTFSEVLIEGEYRLETKNLHSKVIEDVQPGTSYDPSISKKREEDSDGFSLKVLGRNNSVKYVKLPSQVLLDDTEINNIFYLDSLGEKILVDSNSQIKNVFNLSSDNKIGFIESNKDVTLSHLKYVVLKRNLTDPYQNFRTLPYYLENPNMLSTTSCEIFNGDSFISPLKYTSSLLYDIKLRNRRTKSGLWNYISGVLSIAGGVTLGIVTAGASSNASLALIGFGVSQIKSGIEKSQISKVYQNLYEQGLSDTINDTDTDSNFSNNPEDDEIQYFFDVIDTLWFESSVNINFRHGLTLGLTDFQNPLEFYNDNAFESYMLEKVTKVNNNSENSSDDGRVYLGYSMAEIYEINLDYIRRNKQKIFSHLPLEYDCCSECQEEFPHRIAYSNQSFQEELTDNYNVFLINNYFDINGDTGKVVNTFTIQNNFYIHTEECLWHLPNSIQERITGDIVSFLGTGEFFSVPPRKIVDNLSVGALSQNSNINTPYGFFFISKGYVYRFNGNELVPISDLGMYSYFSNEIDENSDIICGYDSKHKRVFFTKKDVSSLSKSFTLSFSIDYNCWVSWHSYFPEYYLCKPDNLFTIKESEIWKHNIEGDYQRFYGVLHKFIIEEVAVSANLRNINWDSLSYIVDTEKYDANVKSFNTVNKFFDEILVYTDRQTTGLLNIISRLDFEAVDFFSNQITLNTSNNILIERKQEIWNLNKFRDYRTNYNEPIFIEDKNLLSISRFEDKKLNNVVDFNKNWLKTETIKNNYLVIRLIFNNFDNVKMVVKYSLNSK